MNERADSDEPSNLWQSYRSNPELACLFSFVGFSRPARIAAPSTGRSLAAPPRYRPRQEGICLVVRVAAHRLASPTASLRTLRIKLLKLGKLVRISVRRLCRRPTSTVTKEDCLVIIASRCGAIEVPASSGRRSARQPYSFFFLTLLHLTLLQENLDQNTLGAPLWSSC